MKNEYLGKPLSCLQISMRRIESDIISASYDLNKSVSELKRLREAIDDNLFKKRRGGV